MKVHNRAAVIIPLPCPLPFHILHLVGLLLPLFLPQDYERTVRGVCARLVCTRRA